MPGPHRMPTSTNNSVQFLTLSCPLRVINFSLVLFALIYGTILMVTSSHYCSQLESSYNETLCSNRIVIDTDIMVSSTADPTTSPTTSPMELSPEEFLSIFCDRYTKWHSCAIVGIFVGSLVLVYSIWSLNRRREWFRGYEEYQNLDDNSVRRKISLYRRLFLCIVAVSIFMITTVFSVLVASQAHILGSKEPYNGLKPGAIAYIVTLGFGIGLFALGIFAKVILKPMEEFIREIS